MCTGTSLSVCQEGWDDDEPPLPHTHAQETLVHAFDEVTLTQVGVVGRIPRVTKEEQGKVFGEPTNIT